LWRAGRRLRAGDPKSRAEKTKKINTPNFSRIKKKHPSKNIFYRQIFDLASLYPAHIWWVISINTSNLISETSTQALGGSPRGRFPPLWLRASAWFEIIKLSAAKPRHHNHPLIYSPLVQNGRGVHRGGAGQFPFLTSQHIFPLHDPLRIAHHWYVSIII
jgi:hypothetical protein